MTAQYYVRRGNKVSGPTNADVLKQYASAGALKASDQVSISSDGPWHVISQVPALASHLPAPDPFGDLLSDPLGAIDESDLMATKILSQPSPVAARPKPKVATTKSKRHPLLLPAIAGGGLLVALLVVAGVVLFSGGSEVRETAIPGSPTSSAGNSAAQPQPLATANPFDSRPDPEPATAGAGSRQPQTAAVTPTAATQPDASATPLPDAATVKQTLTPTPLAVGDPIENSIGMVLVPIPAGDFLMGSPATEPGRQIHRMDKFTAGPGGIEAQHQVTLTKPFLLGVHEVTQGQYQAVMGTTPWKGKNNVKEGDDYPATYVRWHSAAEFCRKLSEKEGVEYRLPTEAEWEYACRAGTTAAYSFGDDASELGKYAWYGKNAWDVGQKYAHTVGQKKPNQWGLYDMHGNVWEWCSDWYGNYPSGSTTDPTGPASGSYRLAKLGSRYRVLRGGSFILHSSNVRSASRNNLKPVYRNGGVLGFRVALSPSGQ